MPYEAFSRFYDAVMGDRRETAAYIRGLIADHRPAARTLLELACGTGALLHVLSDDYDVAGLDVSPPMLSLAREKLPRVPFFQADMVTFDLGRKFDVILCVFDSLNHVLRFADWQRTFSRVALHLEPAGVFIFDVNTPGKLRRLIQAPAWVKEFDGNALIMDVADGGEGLAHWNVKVFERQSGNTYRLFAETITEISFPLRTITDALHKQFAEVDVVDPIRPRPSSTSDRLYFVCRR